MNNRRGSPSRSTAKRDQTRTDSAMTQALGKNSTSLTLTSLLITHYKNYSKLTIWLNPDGKVMDNEQFVVSDRQ